MLLHFSQASLVCEMWDNSVIQKTTHATNIHFRRTTFAATANLWIIVPATLIILFIRVIETQHAKVPLLTPICTPRVLQVPVLQISTSIQYFALSITNKNNSVINNSIFWTVVK